jgi:hypothetical protein
VRVKWIEIFVDGLSVTKCSENSASATCTVTRGPFVPGTHNYYATATDTAKLTAKTPILEFVIDAIPSVTVRHSPSVPTSVQTVQFDASANDDIGLKYLEIVVNGSTLHKCIASGTSDVCSAAGGPYPAGTYSYYAKATDIRDQSAQSSKILTVESVTTSLPEISVTHSPLSPTSSNIVTYTATATDDVGLTSIQIFVDNIQLGSCSVSGTSATCTKSAGPYSAGSTHNYFAKVTDTNIQTVNSPLTSFSVSGSEPDIIINVTSEIDLTKLHGVNFIDPVLRKSEASGVSSTNPSFVTKFVKLAKENGFTVLRVPMYWEAYVNNKANFKEEARLIAEAAEANGIYVFFDNHHWYTTSDWPQNVAPSGRGFPSALTRNYNPTGNYESDPEVEIFWDDFYKNKVNGLPTSGEGSAWDLQADYFDDFIAVVDSYDSVLGYEILNEPHIWEVSDYDDLGAYHTYIAGRMSAVTNKAIIFTRETVHGGVARSASREYKILPRLPVGATNEIWYWPHLYNVPGSNVGSGSNQITSFKSVADCWKNTGVCLDPHDTGTGTSCSTQTCANKVKYDVSIGIGEWATQDNQICQTDLNDPVKGQELMDAFVCRWSKEGWPHAYWAYAGFSQALGNVLIKSDGTLTVFGQRYVNSIKKYYPTFTGTCPNPIQKAYVDEDSTKSGVQC